MTLLQAEISNPLPSPVCKTSATESDKCGVGLLYHALALLYVDGAGAGAARANDELAAAIPRLAAGIGDALPARASDRTEKETDEAFHFQRAGLLYRALRLFGSRGTRLPGAINPDVERGVLALFQRWSSSYCRLSDADPHQTWRIWASENHHAQLVASCWAAADLLRRQPERLALRYRDGSNPDQQYDRWNAFVAEYIRQRGRFGLIESDSPTYAAYTLGTFYNYADFAEDGEVRRLARSFLDIWWAQWAAEQIDGAVGASKSRAYPSTLEAGTPLQPAAWTYFGLGPRPGHGPAAAAALTSSYSPPQVVETIAARGADRGTYDVVSTAPGRRLNGTPGYWYTVDPQAPATLRRTHVAPGFVMGTAMLPLLPLEQWAGSSAQNRWDGVVFAGGGQARIVPTALPLRGEATYNALSGVQDGGAQIVQAPPPPFSKNVADMRVWFGAGLKPVELNGWVFVQSSAYAAVKPVRGGFRWDDRNPGWMILGDRSSPIIIQAAPTSNFKDFTAFQKAVLQAPVEDTPEFVDYRGVSGEHIRLSSNHALPQVGGANVDLTPPESVHSPFVTVVRATGAARICDHSDCVQLQF